MAYVGNEPTSNFASVTKDLFSGDGSTVAFTLSKVATTNGVAVFVENVRQEPTIAYAVSGTTLTFTAAPVSSSGNNIYVLHHNAVASTANHPASQDLTAVAGTFTSNVTIGSGSAADRKILFDGNAVDYHIGLDDSADTLNIGKGPTLGTTTAMTFDTNGIITKPLQPAFLVKPDGNSSALTADSYFTIEFDSEIFDNNADFNTTNYTFTAPVTGRYQLNFSSYLYLLDTAADYYLLFIDTSNNDYSVILDPGGYSGDINYRSFVVNHLVDMDASDTAVVKVYQQTGSNQTLVIAGNYTWFSGYLVA